MGTNPLLGEGAEDRLPDHQLRELQTVDKAPSFREAFAKRRCLIPADEFYEWRKTTRPKAPFAIAMKDGRAPHLCRALEKTGKISNLGSGCALARLSLVSLMSSPEQIHPRMPVILPRGTSRDLARGN